MSLNAWRNFLLLTTLCYQLNNTLLVSLSGVLSVISPHVPQ